MFLNRRQLMILIVVLALVAAACTCTSALPNLGSSESEGTPEPETVEEPREVEPPEAGEEPSGPAGEALPQTHENLAGGFRLNLPEGWVATDFLFTTVAAANEEALGSDDFTVPVLFVFGGPMDETSENVTDPQDLLDSSEFEDMTGDFTVSEFEETTVGGFPAAAANIEGADPDTGQEIRGRIVFVLGDEQTAMFLGAAPPDQWDAFAPTFESMLDTVVFFPPDMEAGLEDFGEDFGEDVEIPTGLTEQWASSVTASSEYGSDGWSAAQVTGEPDAYPECGDMTEAWASETPDQKEWLDVSFDTAVIPTEIEIYQTYNPGAITLVEVIDENRIAYTVYEADPTVQDVCPSILTINVDQVAMPVKRVKIYLDQSATGEWNEIDAVKLIGIPLEGGSAPPPAVSGADVPMPSGGETSIEFVNNTDSSICYIYVTPTAADAWDDNVSEFISVPSGKTHIISGLAAGFYDIKVEDCKLNVIAWEMYIEIPASSTPIEAPVDPPEHTLTFFNDLDESICGVYMTRVEDFEEKGWRRNLLSSFEVIFPDQERLFKSGAGEWNLRLETCSTSRVIEVFGTSVSGHMSYRISEFE